MAKEYVVGVDIGGQTTKIGVVDKEGKILNQTVINSKYGRNEEGLFMDAVAVTIKELAAGVGLENINGVGVGAPNGNFYTGEVVDAANLEWGKGKAIPLAKSISERLG